MAASNGGSNSRALSSLLAAHVDDTFFHASFYKSDVLVHAKVRCQLLHIEVPVDVNTTGKGRAHGVSMPDLRIVMLTWCFVVLCASASAAPQSYLIVAALADADELLADVDSKSALDLLSCMMQILAIRT